MQALFASAPVQWPTFGGNTAHTGFIPIDLNIEQVMDVNKLVWTRNLTTELSYSTIFANTLLVTSTNSFTNVSKLFVLNALTGYMIHTINLTAADSNEPAIGRYEYMAYVQTIGTVRGIYLQAINLITGDIQWTAVADTQGSKYPYGTTPGSKYIYMPGGVYNEELYAVDPYNGSIIYRAQVFPRTFACDWWTPTVYNKRIFIHSQPGQGTLGGFGEINPDTGPELWSIVLNNTWDGYSTYWEPVIMNDVALVSTRQESFSLQFHGLHVPPIVKGSFQDYTPSTDGVSAYFTCKDGIHQVLIRSGKLQRLFACKNCAGQPIVTNHHLIISSNGNGTIIFNKESGQISMQVEETGNLAVHPQAKILYIINSDTGMVVAYAI
ncbi:unnamed protein product [Adineta ricciae]|uniref:Uncharacterized protein n=1 Tax=Adineta ricciae TaxID=249248 RepID=A0A816BKH6_ADIRI|nr:unnamed protein product [Adineta ricciae]CAF1611979.1 unnamed protein product [Adineta ricciae]